jgi:hypothetical protein
MPAPWTNGDGNSGDFLYGMGMGKGRESSDGDNPAQEVRARLIGLGAGSIRKSYYPE